MKINLSNLLDVSIVLIFTFVILMILSAPFSEIFRIITTQKALNEQCKTNYNFIQVATAGDDLSRLCQIKNQTVTINE